MSLSASWGLCQCPGSYDSPWTLCQPPGGYVSALGGYFSLLGATSVTWGQKLDKEGYSSSSTLNLVSTRTLNGLLRSTQHTEMNTADAWELAA